MVWSRQSVADNALVSMLIVEQEIGPFSSTLSVASPRAISSVRRAVS